MKEILGVELSHRFTPISVRERMVLNTAQTKEAIEHLKQFYSEVYVLSTCNRLSFYVLGKDFSPLLDYLDSFGSYRRYLSIFPNTEIAVRNLFSTVSGLESQVVGEHQIVGQAKQFFSLAKKEKSVGPFINELIRKSINVSRRIKLNTDIGKYSASLATVGFDIINEFFNKDKKPVYLIIGTGNMANLVNTVVNRDKTSKIYVASHDINRAKDVAQEWKGIPLDINNIYEALAEADVVVGGTQGEINLLHEEVMNSSKCPRSNIALSSEHEKLFIDFGVPRNFNPSLKQHDNVTLYDLDDMKKITDKSLLKRYDEIPKARKLINEEVERYLEWHKNRMISPIIKEYISSVEEQINSEVNWLAPKFQNLTEREKDLLKKFAHRLKRKISKQPIKGFKQVAQEGIGQSQNPMDTLATVFDFNKKKLKVVKKEFVIGTRGSKLALTQTNTVVQELKTIHPDYNFKVKVIKTLGDGGDLNQVGAFTSTLQRALLKNEIDFCVHSYKDVPTQMINGLRVIPVMPREDSRDALISKQGEAFFDLKPGSIVGTSSNRRIAQMKMLRPDLEYKVINGNIDKRLQKLSTETYDAIVLAMAGLKRLKMESYISSIFTIEQLLPAVAQGSLAVEFLDKDSELSSLLEQIQVPQDVKAIEAERIFMIAIGGGCQSPIACHAIVNELRQEITIHGFYATENFEYYSVFSKTGPLKDKFIIAEQVAQNLLSNVKQRQEENTLQ